MSRVLNFPTTAYYTIQDLIDKNPHFNKDITIRVRHTRAIESGEVVEIGRVTGGKGAPPKVYAKTPITDALLEKATRNGIQLADDVKSLVNVMTVTPPVASSMFKPAMETVSDSFLNE